MSVALAFTGQKSCDDAANKIIPENRIEGFIRDLCGLFVIVVDKRIYLLHQTAREFLVHDNSEKKKSGNGHSSNPKNYYVVAIIFISHTLTLLLAVLSAIYWVEHYSKSTRQCKAGVAQMTRDLCLLSDRRARWTKVYKKFNLIPFTGSPLCLASALGLERAVKLFLSEKDPNSVDLINQVDSEDYDGRTPLSWAAQKEHKAVIKLLLEKGADMTAADKFGWKPLLWASRKGHLEVIKLLLKKGAHIEAATSSFHPPLLWASGDGNFKVVKLLLEKGVDAAAADIVELLLDNSADPSIENENGWVVRRTISGI